MMPAVLLIIPAGAPTWLWRRRLLSLGLLLLLVVLILTISLPAPASTPACKGAAPTPAPVPTPASTSRPIWRDLLPHLLVQGLVPQARHQLHLVSLPWVLASTPATCLASISTSAPTP